MDEKALLDAMRAMIQPIIDKQDEMSAKQDEMSADMQTMKDDMDSLKKDVTHLMHTVEPQLKIIREGIEGLQERNRQVDSLQETVEAHDDRIFALEQAHRKYHPA